MTRATSTTRARLAPTYDVYGLRLATHHQLDYHVPRCAGPADLTFATVTAPPLPAGWEDTPARFDPTARGGVDERVGAVLVVGDCTVVRFPEIADFFVFHDRILAQLLDPDYVFALELLLLGSVVALWLELHGVPTLHAASVAVDGHAVGFLATNKGGKSTLAAAFVQRGAALLGDDLLPLEHEGATVVARPGYPQMRFWPEQAERLLGSTRRWPRVQPGSPKLRVAVGPEGFGSFAAVPCPLARLYLPERCDDAEGVTITHLGLGERVVELVRHSFLAGVLEALALAPKRFTAFGSVARRVPVARLRYPSGIEHLDAVCESVIADLNERRPVSTAER